MGQRRPRTRLQIPVSRSLNSCTALIECAIVQSLQIQCVWKLDGLHFFLILFVCVFLFYVDLNSFYWWRRRRNNFTNVWRVICFQERSWRASGLLPNALFDSGALETGARTQHGRRDLGNRPGSRLLLRLVVVMSLFCCSFVFVCYGIMCDFKLKSVAWLWSMAWRLPGQ